MFFNLMMTYILCLTLQKSIHINFIHMKSYSTKKLKKVVRMTYLNNKIKFHLVFIFLLNRDQFYEKSWSFHKSESLLLTVCMRLQEVFAILLLLHYAIRPNSDMLVPFYSVCGLRHPTNAQWGSCRAIWLATAMSDWTPCSINWLIILALCGLALSSMNTGFSARLFFSK